MFFITETTHTMIFPPTYASDGFRWNMSLYIYVTVGSLTQISILYMHNLTAMELLFQNMYEWAVCEPHTHDMRGIFTIVTVAEKDMVNIWSLIR